MNTPIRGFPPPGYNNKNVTTAQIEGFDVSPEKLDEEVSCAFSFNVMVLRICCLRVRLLHFFYHHLLLFFHEFVGK